MNPFDELGDFVNERREEILKRCADLGRKYKERIQAHHNWIVEKQTYLNRQAPPHEWVDGKLTIRPGWVPPSQAWLNAQNERIKSHEKLFDAAKAAETAAESALQQAHGDMRDLRAGWPRELGPFPVDYTELPDADQCRESALKAQADQ